MAEQAGPDARIKEDGQHTAFELGGVEASYRPLPCACSDGDGAVKILQVARAMTGMIPLHIRARASKDAGPGRMAGARISACKTVAGGERDLAAAIRCPTTFAVRNARHGARGFFRLKSAGTQQGGFRIAGVGYVEFRQAAAQQPILGRQASIGVFRRFTRHGDAAIDQCTQGGRIHVRRCNAGGALPDENAQADFLAL